MVYINGSTVSMNIKMETAPDVTAQGNIRVVIKTGVVSTEYNPVEADGGTDKITWASGVLTIADIPIGTATGVYSLLAKSIAAPAEGASAVITELGRAVVNKVAIATTVDAY